MVGVFWLFWLTPPLLLWPAGIRQLQLMLLKMALLLGIEIHVNVEFRGLIEPPEDQETESKFAAGGHNDNATCVFLFCFCHSCRFTNPLFTTPSKTQKHRRKPWRRPRRSNIYKLFPKVPNNTQQDYDSEWSWWLYLVWCLLESQSWLE